MRRLDISYQHKPIRLLTNRQRKNYLAVVVLLCLSGLFLVACNSSKPTIVIHPHKSMQTDNGQTVTYNTSPQDVLVRLFYGGGKVGSLQITPEVSIYGDGTFITGPGLQPQTGSLSSDQLQNLLHTLVGTDNLLQLQQQVFDDIPDQNATLLQIALNGKNYQFTYGPFGNLQESSQSMQEYQQLGQAISTIRNGLTGPLQPYTSHQKAMLVYQTFRPDYTESQNLALPIWPLTTLNLQNAATYECGVIARDITSSNADNGCLVYTVPHFAILLVQNDQQALQNVLPASQQQMFLVNGHYFVVMLRPLLPDELIQEKLAMYGSNVQVYAPVTLKSGPVPIPTITITPES